MKIGLRKYHFRLQTKNNFSETTKLEYRVVLLNFCMDMFFISIIVNSCLNHEDKGAIQYKGQDSETGKGKT